MTAQNDGRPQAVARQRAFANVQACGCERSKPTPKGSHDQAWTEARRCEDIARNCARAALGQRGSLAFQRAALSRHYAGRAAALMLGTAR
jgi:hypothetical protein